MRRRRREERLQVCQDGRLRFAAKRMVSTWRAVARGQGTLPGVDVTHQSGRPSLAPIGHDLLNQWLGLSNGGGFESGSEAHPARRMWVLCPWWQQCWG